MRRTLVTADIHGNYEALYQCMQRSKFDYVQDQLIVLGDVCDGFVSDIDKCIELLKIPNVIFILGNHDLWALEWFSQTRNMDPKIEVYPIPEHIWLSQGGINTLKSYDVSGELEKPGKRINYKAIKIPNSHFKFLEEAYLYYEDEKNRLFVHGGINPMLEAKQHSQDILLWDRSLIINARKKHFQNKKKYAKMYKEVFIGHTQTNIKEIFKSCAGTEPIHYCNIWDIDTGAGWGGKLTFMDVDTKEYWQSDLVEGSRDMKT